MGDNSQPSVQATQIQPAQQGQKGSGKGLLILVIVFVGIICLVGIVVGAVLLINNANNNNKSTNTTSQGTTNTNTTKDSTNNQNPDTQNGTTSNDNSTFSFGGSLPQGFPNDVPIMPNSTIGFSSSDTDGSFSVTASVKSKVADIMNFYKENLGRNGWTITSEQSIFGASITAEKNDSVVTIVSLSDDSQSEQGYIISVAKN